MKKAIDFNLDQVEHISLVQQLVYSFTNKLMTEALTHDASKFSKKEYCGFIDARDSLKESKDGLDDNYQEKLKGEAIQNHYKENRHHPEYWKDRKEKMPLTEIIIMYFDWMSRSIVKMNNFSNFWEYNKKKLIDNNQGHAVSIIELLQEEFDYLNKEYSSKIMEMPYSKYVKENFSEEEKDLFYEKELPVYIILLRFIDYVDCKYKEYGDFKITQEEHFEDFFRSFTEHEFCHSKHRYYVCKFREFLIDSYQPGFLDVDPWHKKIFTSHLGKFCELIEIKIPTLTHSEALYGFMGWLTSKTKTSEFTGKHDLYNNYILSSFFCYDNNISLTPDVGELSEGFDPNSVKQNGEIVKFKDKDIKSIPTSEILLSFIDWVTLIKEESFIFPRDATKAAELVDEFCKSNRISEPSGTYWNELIIHPHKDI